MKEIKFRAWDHQSKKMYNAGEGDSDEHSFLLNFFGDVISDYQKKNTLEHKQVFARVGHDLELMQYTGLKDKNGKEIYEGDIIKHSNNQKEYFDEILWRDDQWVVGTWQPDGLSNFNCEVVGNIYEDDEIINPIF